MNYIFYSSRILPENLLNSCTLIKWMEGDNFKAELMNALREIKRAFMHRRGVLIHFFKKTPLFAQFEEGHQEIEQLFAFMGESSPMILMANIAFLSKSISRFIEDYHSQKDPLTKLEYLDLVGFLYIIVDEASAELKHPNPLPHFVVFIQEAGKDVLKIIRSLPCEDFSTRMQLIDSLDMLVRTYPHYFNLNFSGEQEKKELIDELTAKAKSFSGKNARQLARYLEMLRGVGARDNARMSQLFEELEVMLEEERRSLEELRSSLEEKHLSLARMEELSKTKIDAVNQIFRKHQSVHQMELLDGVVEEIFQLILKKKNFVLGYQKHLRDEERLLKHVLSEINGESNLLGSDLILEVNHVHRSVQLSTSSAIRRSNNVIYQKMLQGSHGYLDILVPEMENLLKLFEKELNLLSERKEKGFLFYSQDFPSLIKLCSEEFTGIKKVNEALSAFVSELSEHLEEVELDYITHEMFLREIEVEKHSPEAGGMTEFPKYEDLEIIESNQRAGINDSWWVVHRRTKAVYLMKSAAKLVDFRAELIGHRILNLFGLGVADTSVVQDDKGKMFLVSKYQESSGSNIYLKSVRSERDVFEFLRKNDVDVMYILDAIINNRDRHPNNFRIVKGPFGDNIKNWQVLLIDNGLCGPSSEVTNREMDHVYVASFYPTYTLERKSCGFEEFMEAYARNEFYEWLWDHGIKERSFLWRVAVQIVKHKLTHSNVKRIVKYAYKIVPQVKDLDKIPKYLGHSKDELDERERSERILTPEEFIKILLARKDKILSDLMVISEGYERALPSEIKPEMEFRRLADLKKNKPKAASNDFSVIFEICSNYNNHKGYDYFEKCVVEITRVCQPQGINVKLNKVDCLGLCHQEFPIVVNINGNKHTYNLKSLFGGANPKEVAELFFEGLVKSKIVGVAR